MVCRKLSGWMQGHGRPVRWGMGLLLTTMLLFEAAGCNRRGGCPEGFYRVKETEGKRKTLWCATKDRTRSRWFEFHEGGKARRQACTYLNNRAEGSYSAWYPGGHLWIEGTYQFGTKVGHWVQWSDKGIKTAEGDYRTGDFVAGAPVGLPAICENLKL